jgi:hypothetical protein
MATPERETGVKKMKIKRRIAAIVITLLVLLLAVSPVFAASPHFIKVSASITNSGNLVVSWKEAGLGNDELIQYLANANATAEYACVNGGGKHPQATNKETVNGPVSAAGSFSSGKNGTINGSLTLTPPSAGSFSCPAGQSLVLARVIYYDVSLSDLTNGITVDISGEFQKIFFNF